MLKLVMSELEYLSCIYYYTITSWLMLHWIGFKFNTWSSFVFDREFSEGTEKKLTSLEVLCVDTNAGCPLVLNPFNLRSRSNPNGSPVISEKRKWRTKCFDTETIFSNFQKKIQFSLDRISVVYPCLRIGCCCCRCFCCCCCRGCCYCCCCCYCFCCCYKEMKYVPTISVTLEYFKQLCKSVDSFGFTIKNLPKLKSEQIKKFHFFGKIQKIFL